MAMRRLVFPEPTLPIIARLEPFGTVRSISFNKGLPCRIHEKLPCTLIKSGRVKLRGLQIRSCRCCFILSSSRQSEIYAGTPSIRGVPLGASRNFMYACNRRNAGNAHARVGTLVVNDIYAVWIVISIGRIVQIPYICDLLLRSMYPQSATVISDFDIAMRKTISLFILLNQPYNRSHSISRISFIFSSPTCSHPQALITRMLKNNSSM
mmetsp:Transcript_29444/g.52053  ORF Transcript_29444/g.52053 Transcript_29444/m.52053 type:complete len:209 (-) Transcript_29444:1668-2294(-)